MRKKLSYRTAPGPRGHPILGNLTEFRRDALQLLMDSVRQYGDVVRFRLGPRVVHLVNHPDHIRWVLQENRQNYDRGTRSAAKIRSVCGDSLLTSDGETWRRQRRLVAPAFQQKQIASFSPLMVEATGAMLGRWKKRAEDGVPLDVASEMMRLTYTIVGRALFGADVSSESRAVDAAMHVILSHTYRRLERLFDPPEVLMPLQSRRFRRAITTVDNVIYRIMEERNRKDSGSNDLLSRLVMARDEDTGDRLSNEQLRNEIITLLLSGHETTASALAWVFFLLSSFPSVQRRIQTEVAEEVGDRLPTPEDIPKLKYTSMVISEAIRLYPPIWILERRAVRDDEIGGYYIPAQSAVVVSPYALHRHPAFWENPEGFDPERFADVRPGDASTTAYLPFGGGPHRCIGSSFAMQEAHIIVAMVSQRYRLALVPGHPVQPKPGITLRPSHGLLMTLTKSKENDPV